MRHLKGIVTITAALLAAACSSDHNRGVLEVNPPQQVASLTAAQFQGALSASANGQGVLAVAGAPACGVNVHYLKYGTVGGAGEATNATGALMVPTGSSAACSGPRPVVLYAHGTTLDKRFNIASLTDSTNAGNGEAVLTAATFAAQGFIVVAPNYAGYDASTLGYHPYLNAEQQSSDMIDALTAARTALASLGVADSGKLFISGYSQGGHVAMATHRALQAAGRTVTASAPASGPYALLALVDAVYFGNVNLGSTQFSPLLISSYQKSYGNIYSNAADFYAAPYATGVETLVPANASGGELIAAGKLPAYSLFSSTPPTSPNPALQPLFNSITPPTTPAAQAPLFALGFGSTPLITNATRLAYLLDAVANPDGAVPTATTGLPATAPASTMRQALKKNDLRNWTPTRPVMLCGGGSDPVVFFPVDTGVMKSYWSAPSPAAVASAALLTVLDVDSAATGSADPYAAVKAGFAQFKAQTAAASVAAGAKDGGAMAVIAAYHGTLVPPFCTVAARGFFQQVLASGL